MGEGRGLYYIAKYTEESYEENGINGHWLTCPQMGSLLQEYYQTNLHMDFGASGGAYGGGLSSHQKHRQERVQ